MLDSFQTKIMKAKEKRFRDCVLKASKIMGIERPLEVKIWDENCPNSTSPDEIAHYHPELGLICISKSRLSELSFEGIEEVATHEVSHAFHLDHGAEFRDTVNDASLKSWLLSHQASTAIRIDEKHIKRKDENECSYHLCDSKINLKECPHCGNRYCEKHIEPRMSLNLHQVSFAKEPLRSILDKEYRREDGHPDWDYTKSAWVKLEEDAKKEGDKLWEALEYLKKVGNVFAEPPTSLQEIQHESDGKYWEIGIRKLLAIVGAIFVFIIIIVIFLLRR
jgi:hypothetical protein